jgi:hypothetical protein
VTERYKQNVDNELALQELSPLQAVGDCDSESVGVKLLVLPEAFRGCHKRLNPDDLNRCANLRP